jgi:hypothetical protein
VKERFYPDNWGEIRKQQLLLDQHRCRACGINADQLKALGLGRLHVHHCNSGPPDYEAAYGLEVPGANLATLCPTCHHAITRSVTKRRAKPDTNDWRSPGKPLAKPLTEDLLVAVLTVLFCDYDALETASMPEYSQLTHKQCITAHRAHVSRMKKYLGLHIDQIQALLWIYKVYLYAWDIASILAELLKRNRVAATKRSKVTRYRYVNHGWAFCGCTQNLLCDTLAAVPTFPPMRTVFGVGRLTKTSEHGWGLELPDCDRPLLITSSLAGDAVPDLAPWTGKLLQFTGELQAPRPGNADGLVAHFSDIRESTSQDALTPLTGIFSGNCGAAKDSDRAAETNPSGDRITMQLAFRQHADKSASWLRLVAPADSGIGNFALTLAKGTGLIAGGQIRAYQYRDSPRLELALATLQLLPIAGVKQAPAIASSHTASETESSEIPF